MEQHAQEGNFIRGFDAIEMEFTVSARIAYGLKGELTIQLRYDENPK